jgi:hypothetical protein
VGHPKRSSSIGRHDSHRKPGSLLRPIRQYRRPNRSRISA